MCASPQKENGFTPIANEILEALARTNLSSFESQFLHIILRNTYGFHRKVWHLKKWKELELSTGIQKSHIKEILLSLSKKNIIKLNWENKEIEFQKNYDNWQEIEKRSHHKKVTPFVTIENKKVTPFGNFLVPPFGNSELRPLVTKVTPFGNSTPSKQALPLASPDPKDNLKIVLKKDLKEISSSVPWDHIVPGDEIENEKSAALDDDIFKSKSEGILSKHFPDLSVFLREDLIEIGKYEEKQIETVVLNSKRQGIYWKNVSVWIMKGLKNYSELYEKELLLSKQEAAPVRLLQSEITPEESEYQRIRQICSRNRVQSEIISAMQILCKRYKDDPEQVWGAYGHRINGFSYEQFLETI